MADMHLQHVWRSEVQESFFKHVRKVVVEMDELRTLQGLLMDYNKQLHNFDFDYSGNRPSTIKRMSFQPPPPFTTDFTRIKAQLFTTHPLEEVM